MVISCSTFKREKKKALGWNICGLTKLYSSQLVSLSLWLDAWCLSFRSVTGCVLHSIQPTKIAQQLTVSLHFKSTSGWHRSTFWKLVWGFQWEACHKKYPPKSWWSIYANLWVLCYMNVAKVSIVKWYQIFYFCCQKYCFRLTYFFKALKRALFFWGMTEMGLLAVEMKIRDPFKIYTFFHYYYKVLWDFH